MQTRHRTQKTLSLNIGADFASGCHRLKKPPECGFESLIEVRRQGVESWVSRMQGLSQPAFGSDKGCVPLQPFSQRLSRPMLGCEIVGGISTSIDLMTKDRRGGAGSQRVWP